MPKLNDEVSIKNLASTDAAPSDVADPPAPPQSALPARRRLSNAVLHGFHEARPVERAAIGMTGSFAATIVASRAINYVRERKRSLPRTRGLARILVQFPRSNAIRVHHFLPGIAIAFASGATAIATHTEERGDWLSVPFGVGVGLTTDELRMLAGRSNPYWGNEMASFAQAGAALIVCGALCALTARRGLPARAEGSV